MPDAHDRRARLGDAGIQVLAQAGLRGLTHRAVDRAAGLPHGSTSYHARTREALVALVVERLTALDLDAPPPPEGAPTRAGLAAYLAAAAAWQADAGRERTAARYALLLAGPSDSAAVLPLLDGRARVREALLDLLRTVQHPVPDELPDAMIALLDGYLLGGLTSGRGVDEPALRNALLRQLGG